MVVYVLTTTIEGDIGDGWYENTKVEGVFALADKAYLAGNREVERQRGLPINEGLEVYYVVEPMEVE